MYRYMVSAVALVFFSMPCLAAVEFYVAQDPTAKDCKIVKEKPDGKTLIMLGASYPTREAAKAAKKSAPECQRPGEE
jgi:hypothetical protein